MYKIFETELEAMDFSHSVAIIHGLGKAGDTCQYWYAWRQTANNKWAVQCPEGTYDEPKWMDEEIET